MSRICAIGDAVIDVIVEPTRILAPDDDVPARIRLTPGGQAANVAAWCVALGTAAAVITRMGDDVTGRLVRELLARHGVTVLSPPAQGMTGAVVSLIGPRGQRTMASDRGAATRLAPDELRSEWFTGCSWLHMSGYVLLGAGSGRAALLASVLARAHGARISVDVSAATVVAALGAAETRRRLANSGAELVFANEAEARALGEVPVPTLVVKRGPAGYRIWAGGRYRDVPAAPGGIVRDTTGAGDAFAAGWLIGGPELAVRAARSCIEHPGAMPPATPDITLIPRPDRS